ncbi:MAG TPA: hypothetical protein VND65_12855 [Candidatus Binatia bacterium]|nr:hypothetical protein [Candidatus Binatia bacterium]
MTDDESGEMIDHRIEAVLAKYSNVEPRAGLEGRILANLHSQPQRVARAWWRWLAVAAAVLIIVLSFATRRTLEPVRTSNPIIRGNEDEFATKVPHEPEPRRSDLKKATVRNSPRPSVRAAAVISRLPKFPSPEPESNQEKMLVLYVSRFEQQAILIARFNEDDLHQDRLEFIEGAPPTNGALEENEIR